MRDERIHVRTAVKGRVLVKILVKGKLPHSSWPEDGLNAVLKMSKVLLAIDNHGFNFLAHHLYGVPYHPFDGFTHAFPTFTPLDMWLEHVDRYIVDRSFAYSTTLIIGEQKSCFLSSYIREDMTIHPVATI